MTTIRKQNVCPGRHQHVDKPLPICIGVSGEVNSPHREFHNENRMLVGTSGRPRVFRNRPARRAGEQAPIIRNLTDDGIAARS